MDRTQQLPQSFFYLGFYCETKLFIFVHMFQERSSSIELFVQHSLTQPLTGVPVVLTIGIKFSYIAAIPLSQFLRHILLNSFYLNSRLHILTNRCCVILPPFSLFSCLFICMSGVSIYFICVFVFLLFLFLFTYLSITSLLWTVCPC